MRITKSWLKKNYACRAAVKEFDKLFPRGTKVDVKAIRKAALSKNLALGFLVDSLHGKLSAETMRAYYALPRVTHAPVDLASAPEYAHAVRQANQLIRAEFLVAHITELA